VKQSFPQNAMARRKRQFGLFLGAVALSAAALSILTFRFLAQDEELAREREPGQRQQAVQQAERELLANLEKIRLTEINRRIRGPEPSAPATDPAIVFAAPLEGERLILPWEAGNPLRLPSARFVSNREAGETHEFQSKSFSKAAAAYRSMLADSQQPGERCESELSLARVLAKQEASREAGESYGRILQKCSSIEDDQGIPFAFYAAERLLALKLDTPGAMDYLFGQVNTSRLRPLRQTYMLQTLLQDIDSDAAGPARAELDRQIQDFQKVTSLSKELSRVLPLARKGWIIYGEEPWLLTVTDATPQPPLLLAVASRKAAPSGTTLGLTPTAGSSVLAQFPGLHMTLDASRSFTIARAPAFLIATGIGFIVLLTVLSGYLLLRAVNRDLQMAETRSHFVASVSHELKTPLTAIRMFAETLVLGRTANEAARTEYLETIVNESERLARLVDNVLDFSKIEQGKKIYRMKPTHLPDVIRSAARAIQYPLTQQGFALNVSIDEALPSTPADADALEQAVLNLLSNAMKYSKHARQIDLTCSRDNGNALIAVTDHGIGIGPQDQQQIFEKFYRVRSTDTEWVAGTGLGLTLVKHIVQAHGGSVDVRSEVGHGSTFTIRIPFAPEATA
jgi:signal transduction histidine kinase